MAEKAEKAEKSGKSGRIFFSGPPFPPFLASRARCDAKNRGWGTRPAGRRFLAGMGYRCEIGRLFWDR